MPVLPKSLITVRAGFLSARAASGLKRVNNAGALQEAVFDRLIPFLAQGFVWSDAGIEAGMAYEAFRSKVPLQTHEGLAAHIESMKKGAEDVLWPGRCPLFAVSPGTTPGPAKYIPVTEAMLEHFRRAGLESLLWYTARVRSTRVFKGRHLFLGGAMALAPIPGSAPFEALAGDLSGIAALNLPKWMERHLFEPGAAISQMQDWAQKVEAITERTYNMDISLVAGIPAWVLVLAESLRARAQRDFSEKLTLQEIWPHLECFVHGGVPVSPFFDELRSVLGPRVNFHEVYPATEAFIAAQDAGHEDGLRLMADSGVFFEFLPMADYDEERLHLLGPKAVPLSGVKAGVDYALILTTPSGLARYVLGDVVRFKSTQPPRIIYVGRTQLQLTAFGEHVVERQITDALRALCRRNGWTIVNFHVAPIFAGTGTGMNRSLGRHEWWVELRAGTAITPTGPIMAPELDTELRRLNADYDAKRRSGGMDAPFVRLVMPGVFAQWMRHHGKWGGQHKMPHCRSDRVIADELNAALQFAKD